MSADVIAHQSAALAGLIAREIGLEMNDDDAALSFARRLQGGGFVFCEDFEARHTEVRYADIEALVCVIGWDELAAVTAALAEEPSGLDF